MSKGATMDDILPCPFCGAKAAKHEKGKGASWYPTIHCVNWCCEIGGTGGTRDLMRADALKRWNTRSAAAPAAQADAAPSEPVAWMTLDRDTRKPVMAVLSLTDIDCDICEELTIPLYAAPPAAATAPLTDAARDVLAERQRQVTAEGWTPAHDDEHTESEIALAAACYAMAAGGYAKGQTPPNWPWSLSWWKPAYGRRDLIKAGALILAESERIDRAAIAASADKETDCA
ncbi:Lar family restriction alleviation protein [Paraburkholderia atlantica]|uniref:Lar family restriction alleviation protein n=1 Tax=Paraburkholderia atlantica TaxID=2654982 RepID=UPI000366B9A7|nr:Lar family restriction alleviation protein [Paraburkholderia atlantica]